MGRVPVVSGRSLGGMGFLDVTCNPVVDRQQHGVTHTTEKGTMEEPENRIRQMLVSHLPPSGK